MNIRFEVGGKNYQLTSDKYQMILNEVKTVQSGDNKGEERFQIVGFYKDEFQALKSILDYTKYNSECNSFIELEKLTTDVLARLDEISKMYTFTKGVQND